MSDTGPSLKQWFVTTRDRLLAVGVEQAEADSRWIASHVLGRGRGEIEAVAATTSDPLDADTLAQLEEIVARRLAREPLWHILGAAPFLGMELVVGPGVFSPRPETELLAHTAITELLAMDAPTGRLEVCDVGAGSGAIGLAIARGVSHAQVTSIEPSDRARAYLERNIAQWGDSRVRLIAATAAEALHHIPAQSLDAVVANPPYLIRESDWVDEETGRFDPDDALWADHGGLAVMADVVVFAAHALRKGGVLLVEHGTTHNQPVATLFEAHGFSHVTHQSDLVGRPRLTRATFSGASG